MDVQLEVSNRTIPPASSIVEQLSPLAHENVGLSPYVCSSATTVFVTRSTSSPLATLTTRFL